MPSCRRNGIPLHAQSCSPEADHGGDTVRGLRDGRYRAGQAAPAPVICAVMPATGDGWVCTGRAVEACCSDEKIIEWLEAAAGKLLKKRAAGPFSQAFVIPRAAQRQPCPAREQALAAPTAGFTLTVVERFCLAGTWCHSKQGAVRSSQGSSGGSAASGHGVSLRMQGGSILWWGQSRISTRLSLQPAKSTLTDHQPPGDQFDGTNSHPATQTSQPLGLVKSRAASCTQIDPQDLSQQPPSCLLGWAQAGRGGGCCVLPARTQPTAGLNNSGLTH